MTFSNHYSGTAVSAPSRCVLFTGLHTGHAYIRGNDEMASRGDVWNHKAVLADSTLEGQRPVPAETVMIPAVMKQAGYTTACIGKWGLGYPGSASTPNKMGFDFFYGYNCQLLAHSYYPDHLWDNDKRVELEDNNLNVQYGKGTYSQDLIHGKALEYLDNMNCLLYTSPSPRD